VTLQFHIAAVLLEERVADAEELESALGDLLASMSPRTRRPIRFLDPQTTEPQPLGTDSALGPDSNLPPQTGGSVVPINRNASSQ
jgi:hypothetical protein